VTAFYRQKCLDCQPFSRAAPPTGRLRRTRRTTACLHMPRGAPTSRTSPSTHHRIGRHGQAAARHPTGPPNWCRSTTSAAWGRGTSSGTGLAYLEAARKPGTSVKPTPSPPAATCWKPSTRRGWRTPKRRKSLAEIRWEKDPARSSAYARETLEAKRRPGRGGAPSLCSTSPSGRCGNALPGGGGPAEELVSLRRCSEDWWPSGDVSSVAEQPREALPAPWGSPYDPTRMSHLIHAGLAEAYRQLGDVQRANEHQEKPMAVPVSPGVTPSC